MSRWSLLVVAAAASCGGAPAPRGVVPTPAVTLGAPLVRLRIDDGPVSDPVPHPAYGKVTLRIDLPDSFAGQRFDLAIDRVEAGQVSAWVRCQPRAPQQGPLVFAGLEPGRYSVRATLPDEAEAPAVHGAVDVRQPVTIDVPMTPSAARTR